MSLFHGNRAKAEERGGSLLRLPDDEVEKRRSRLPDAPCFPCGARGWCKHRPEPRP